MRERLFILLFVIALGFAMYGLFRFMPSPDMPVSNYLATPVSRPSGPGRP